MIQVTAQEKYIAVKEGILDVIGTGGSLQNITYGPAKNMKKM